MRPVEHTVKWMKTAGKMSGVGLVLCLCLMQMSCAWGHDAFSLGKRARMGQGRLLSTQMRSAPGNAEAHYLLAGYYQERGRHNEAIAELDKAIAIDPLHIKAYNGLGISYGELHDFTNAKQAYATALSLNPRLDYLHNNLGYTYLRAGDTDAAIAEFQKALALNSSSRVHNNLGLAYLKKGATDKARAELALGGGDAWAHYTVGREQYRQDRFTAASAYFSKALEVNPSLTQARKGLEASETLARMTQALTDTPAAPSADQLPGPVSDARMSLPQAAGNTVEAPHGDTGDYYVIRKGDCLGKILRSVYGLMDAETCRRYFRVILALNAGIKNPDLVYPGQRIFIPAPGSPALAGRYPMHPGVSPMTTALRPGEQRPGNSRG